MRFLFILFLCSSLPALAQENENNNQKDLKDIVESTGLDSLSFLKNFGESACQCIDSVEKVEKNKKLQMKAFATCIDEQVTTYQLSLKLLNTMKSDNKENNIVLATNKNGDEYKKYYYQIERWLKDNCQTLNKALASNDEAGDKSISKNPEALDAYYKGVEKLKDNNYSEAVPWFEKAVSIDPEFAFAWDNAGICYRRMNDLDKAEAAYKASLKVDPRGKTALQNLAVVYQMKKMDKETIECYEQMLKYYKDEPEAYYGLSLLYLQNMNDEEKALNYMCKAYNLYIEQQSAFRSDAEKIINVIYFSMKKQGKEESFYRILKENNIKSN